MTIDTTAGEDLDAGTIEVLPPAQPVSTTAVATLMQHAEMMNTAWNLAEKICRTGMCPATFRGKPEDATVAIMLGSELGLGPLAALQNVITIHGKPSLESRTMVALLEQRGYVISTVEQSDTKVTVEGWSPNRQKHETSTWTIEKAMVRGYVPTTDPKTGKFRTNANGKLIGNEKYLTHPEEMLWAKAAAVVCRRLAPHVLLGLPYTREELESEPEFAAERVEAKRVPSKARGVDGLRSAITPAADPVVVVDAEVANPEPEPAPEPEPEPTKPAADPDALSPSARTRWVKAMFAALNEVDCKDKDDQLIVITELAQRRLDPPAHRDGITDAELRSVVGQLNDARKAGTANDLITGILNEHALRQSGYDDAGEPASDGDEDPAGTDGQAELL